MSESQEFTEDGVVDEVEEIAEDAPVTTEAAGATAEEEQPDALPDPDQRLLDAHDLALAALHEITPASSVGPAAGYSVERDGVVSLRFENALLGYPGWFWTVSLAVVDGSEPTVLEAELLPGDDALLAPEWVPWAVRLKEYQVAQAAAAEAAAAAASTEEQDLPDLDDDDDDEDDEDGSDILHAGDVDGIDIDQHDPDAHDLDDEGDADDGDEDDNDEPDEEADEPDEEDDASDDEEDDAR